MSLIKKKTSSAKVGSKSSATAPRFQYKPRSPEEVRNRMQRNIGGRDSFFQQDVQFFLPRVGDNSVRFCPPPPDADWGHYGMNIAVHYGIGADESAYLCLAKMKGEECPIDIERDRAAAAGEEDLADDLKPSYRVAAYVIDRAQEEKGPLLWNLPAGLDKDISKLCFDSKDGATLNVDDPEEGYDLTFNREGQGLKTKYSGIRFARKASPLADDPEDAEKWLEYVMEHRIDSVLQYFDAEHISKAFQGQAPSGGDDDSKKGKVDKKEKEPAGRKVIQKRGAAAPAKKEDKKNEDLPTFEQLQELDEDDLAALGEENELEFPDEGFDDIDQLREFIAEKLGIEEEEEVKKEKEVEAPAKSNWRDRLKNLSKGK